jgi:cyclase
MITKRIIPCLDVNRGRVVKGVKFADIQDVEDPVTLARFYSEAGADELVFYDITASNEDRKFFVDTIERTADVLRIPLTVGGGVQTVEDFKQLLWAGADKISINSGAVANPNLITEAALRYGNQCVVLSIDVKQTSPGKWEVFTRGGRKATGIDALEWAVRGVELGAGELVLNSIDSDGVRQGYDLALNRTVSEMVEVPVIASGGAGTMEHFLEVLTVGKADAALAASVFHFGDIKIPELKAWLSAKNVLMRGV